MYIDIFTYTIFLNISSSFLFLPSFPSQPFPSWFPNSFLSLSIPSLAPVLSPFLLAAFPFLPASLNPPLSVPFRPLFNKLFPLFSLFCVCLKICRSLEDFHGFDLYSGPFLIIPAYSLLFLETSRFHPSPSFSFLPQYLSIPFIVYFFFILLFLFPLLPVPSLLRYPYAYPFPF